MEPTFLEGTSNAGKRYHIDDAEFLADPRSPKKLKDREVGPSLCRIERRPDLFVLAAYAALRSGVVSMMLKLRQGGENCAFWPSVMCPFGRRVFPSFLAHPPVLVLYISYPRKDSYEA